MLGQRTVISALFVVATALQALAVAYAVLLLLRRPGAAGAWLFLLGAMLSMLVWRVVVMLGIKPPEFFNPTIAIWGSTCVVFAMFLFGREVARRERAEAERDTLLASERAARSEAERAVQLKDDFLGIVSHELRTPLAAILGWSRVLRSPARKPEDVDRGMEAIERSARAQAQLIQDLLDMTRMLSGKLHLERTRVSVHEAVGKAVATMLPTAMESKVELVNECVDRDLMLDADAQRLQQVLLNLLSNAIKFTPPGGWVAVRAQALGAQVCLSVEDSGEGIAPPDLERIFERFKQVDTSIRRTHMGLGLGLSIARNLVELHGGTLNAYSAGPGKGSTFTLCLPVAESGGADSTQTRALPEECSLGGVHLLVVDDNAETLDVHRHLFEQLGARVTTAPNAQAALALLEQGRFDVLISDIGMPGVSGIDLARQVRGRIEWARMPIIALTAYANSATAAEYVKSDFDAVLGKPVSPYELAIAVGRTLSATTTRQ